MTPSSDEAAAESMMLPVDPSADITISDCDGNSADDIAQDMGHHSEVRACAIIVKIHENENTCILFVNITFTCCLKLAGRSNYFSRREAHHCQ